MGTGEVTSGAAFRCMILLLITVCLPLVKSRRTEAPPCPPVKSCHNHLLADDAIGCTPSRGAPAQQDGGDLDPVGDQKLTSAALAEAVVLALLAARKGEGAELETLFILIFTSALFALVFSNILLRNMWPRFTQIVEKLVVVIFVNGVIALRLPARFLWVPAVCLGVSLLTLVAAL